MIKKIIALAATSLLSLNASAGYVQYELSGLGGSPIFYPGGGGRTLIIREEDKTVAYFSLLTDRDWFRPQERMDSYHINMVYETTTSFIGLGPTNMYMRDIQLEEYSKQMWLLFSDGAAPGIFDFSMRVQRQPGPQSPYPSLGPWGESTYTGTARQVALDLNIAAYLDNSNTYVIPYDIPYYDPTQVPEPSSLALLALGAAGAAGALRRRKSKAQPA